MADSLGSLVVSLSAETARFTDALDKAAYQMNRSMGAMVASTKQLETALLKLDGIVGTFGTSLRGLFGVVAVGGMGKLVTSAIDAQAELGRLANRSGTTVEELSGLRVAAHEGGVSLDDMAIAMNRMAKALFEGQDKSTKAAIALEKIGLSAKDLVKLPTAQAFETIAKALNGFNESTGKTAVEMEIFSKSGPKMGAALKAVAENGTVAASVTTEMANAARESEAKFFKLADSFDTLQTKAANQLLPALNGIVDAFVEMQKTNEGTLGFWTALGEGLRVAALGMVTLYTAVKNLIIVEMALWEIQDRIAHADLKGISAAWSDLDKKLNKSTDSLLGFYDTLAKGSPLFGALAKVTGSGAPDSGLVFDRPSQSEGGPKRKDITGGLGTAGTADDPRKAQLAQTIKELDAYAAQEKAILSARDSFLKVYYAQGYLSEKQYYETSTQVMLDALAVEVNTYNAELEAIDAYIAGMNKKKGAEKAVAEAMGQRAQIEEKIKKAQIEASKNVGLFALESQAAALQYQFALHAINAELLALQGNTAAAAAITRADQGFLQRRKLESSGDTGALAQLNERDRLLAIQDKLTESTVRYGLAVQQVGINQASLDLQYAAGAITELDAYAKRADAARAMIPLLTAQADAYEAIAKASGNPAFLLAAQQMRLEIARLAVDADALAKKFTDIFEGAFSTFLTDIVDRTKTVKQAFLDMAKSIEQSISQIAAKNVSEQLFGKEGPLGGVGSFFAKAFGDKGAGGSSADAALAALSASATSATSAITADVTAYLAVATAAQSAATALAAVAAKGAGGGLDSLLGGGSGGGGFGTGDMFGNLDLGGFFAAGTSYVEKDMLAVVHKGEAVIPAGLNAALSKSGVKSGDVHIHGGINVTVPPGTSRATADQIAAATGRAIDRSLRRNS